ncbi:MAG TPA: hypothetical protein PKZ84_20110 [Anaerolineae bacterium]|nr:hypothetical protein [Anaerolineae bacterium]HQI86906.1 hypothetical protein [Anaerolineae bacterium]
MAELEAVNLAHFDLGIAGTALRLDGPEPWLTPLRVAWASWTPAAETPMWPVAIAEDATLAEPQGPLFDARPRCQGGVCTLRAPGFQGTVDAGQGLADLRAHPAAAPADVGYFLRVVLAVQTFARGGMLFHAAGVEHRGKGYALFGVSGSGKTTASQFSAPDPVLNDDLLLLWPSTDGWQMYATPFGKRRGDVRHVALHSLLRLVKDSDVFLAPMSPGQALGELASNTPVLSADPLWLPDVLARWEIVLAAVPAYALHFRRDSTFWEVIDAELG